VVDGEAVEVRGAGAAVEPVDAALQPVRARAVRRARAVEDVTRGMVCLSV
jgi:hypothetical protein